MSDRLAISATLSVLMMSLYVLFGNNVERAPIGPDHLAMPNVQPAPELPANPVRLLIYAN
jgi:hypothetical protein